jgi:cyclase
MTFLAIRRNTMTRSAVLALVFISSLMLSSAQTPSPANSGSLRQIIPGHYVYSSLNGGRPFNSGIIVTSDGALVIDALGSEAVARAERESIAGVTRQPIRYLVSSPFHDQFSKGNLAYGDVFKIGHENYRTGLLSQMQAGGASVEEQRVRLPNATYRDRMAVHLGGKEIQILYLGRAHTDGDSIIFVPQDRIAYLSEIFFSEEFPNMAGGYGVSWLEVLDKIDTLAADIFVPGHGPIPDDPRATRAGLRRLRQIFIDMRDALKTEIAKGATEDQAAAAVKLEQYAAMPNYGAQREVTVRRMYKDLTGKLP